MNIQRYGILIFFLLSFVNGFSQNKSTLTGTILSGTGSPVESAIVVLKNTGYSTVTNSKGEFVLSANPGNYTLVVSLVGHKKTETAVVLKPGNNGLGNISMSEDNMELNAVNVTGKSAVKRVREQAFNVTAIDMKLLHNTSTDLNQVLNRTTGVRVRESGGMGSDFGFSLNGFTGRQVKFFLDGIPIDNYGSSFTLNNIPTNLAERIEIYKGVVPVELGADALGGAINIITNKTVRRYVDASYSFGSFNTHKMSLNTRFTSKKGIVTNLNAFANYSDNSYKINFTVFDPESGVQGPVKEYKHFHDGYKQVTVMAEVGVKDKKYADYLLIGAMATANKKEIQQGITMHRVVGDQFKTSQSFVPSLKYKKTGLFTKNLTASLAASYNIARDKVVDTSSARYDWSGNSTIDTYETGGETNNQKTIPVFEVRSFQSNLNFKYEITDNHFLTLNYSLVDYRRTDTNEYLTIRERGKPSISKNIFGLAYNLYAFEKKLNVNAFGKIYAIESSVVVADEETNRSEVNHGYGIASAYFILPELQLKASYEEAYRLQDASEMLGNGVFTLPNPDLKPESSGNINIGVAYLQKFEKHTVGFQSNLIYREAKNFIRPFALNPEDEQYVNKENVRIKGVDGLIQYGYKTWLNFEVNVTYQKTIDTYRGVYGSNQINYLYGKQLENTPILYGNADLNFTFRDLKYKEDQLAVMLSSNYTDSYYLNAPTLGDPIYKKEIPEQLFHSVNVSYSLNNGQYNIALECRNITDEKLYDYFKVQKPGRSFTVKLRYFFL